MIQIDWWFNTVVQGVICLGWCNVLLHPGCSVNKHHPTCFAFHFPCSDRSRLALMVTSQPGWPSCQQTALISSWPQAENTIIKSSSGIFFKALGGTLAPRLSRPDLLWTWRELLHSKAEQSGFSQTATFMGILHVFLCFSCFELSSLRDARRCGEVAPLNSNCK